MLTFDRPDNSEGYPKESQDIMRLEYQGETRWSPLTGAPLDSFARATGAQVGPGLPEVEWQPLSFYDFTALVRMPDPVGGLTEWYLTNGGRFWPLDRFGVTISAMNETARLRLTRSNVAAYFRFWCAFTHSPKRYIVLDIQDPELADEASDETDPLLRGVYVEGFNPQGWLLSATVMSDSEVQRRYFRVSRNGYVEALERVTASLSEVTSRLQQAS